MDRAKLRKESKIITGENKGIKEIFVSTKNGLVKMKTSEAKSLSKPSTGLLYGK